MDYKIDIIDGVPQMTFEKSGNNNLVNNIYLSLAIKRGSWWFDPEFGSRLYLVRKNNPKAPAMVKEYIREATQWIIDAGRAKTINITAWRDEADRHRINYHIEAIEADGNVTTFTWYKELI